MGVSFKVSKVGARYKPKSVQSENIENENGGSLTDTQQKQDEINIAGKGDMVSDHANTLVKSEMHSEDQEVSFSLNLFRNGFSIGKPTELFNDVPKQLLPYNRTSETLFTAIEYGCLPGDLFDDIPCKFVNGALLCEVRDYRNCFYESAHTDSAVNSPAVHKVLLRMCMENVIKDISSISNDCWTYEDLLESESRVLKALRPNLHLSPEPLLDRVCGEPLTKKLDLGITWDWKKRMLSDAPATPPGFSNQHQTCVPRSKMTIPSAIPNSQKITVVPGTIPQPKLLTTEPNFQLVESCTQSVLVDLTTSGLSFVPTHFSRESNSDLRKPSSLVLPDQGTKEMSAIRRPILMIPKQEPIDFSEQEHIGNQREIVLATELLMKNTLLYQQPEAERLPHKTSHDKRGLAALINNCQQAIVEGTPKLQSVTYASTVNQEPTETSNLPSLDAKKITDKYFAMDVLCDQMAHGKNIRKEIATLKRKALQNPQVTAGVRIGPVSSHQNESLQREASAPAKRKKNSHSKGSSTEVIDPLAATSTKNVTSASNLLLRNFNMPQSLEVKGNPFLERFLKVEEVAQRYGLNNKERKQDKILLRKPLFLSQRLALIPEENVKLEDAKTRTLKFVRWCHVQRENDIPMVYSKAHVKLVILVKRNEGFVGARVLYGYEDRIESTDLLLPPAFPCTTFADLFAAQFTSLMVREGYCLVSDIIETTPFNSEGCSSTQQVTVTGGITPSAGELELPFSSLTPGISTSGNISTVNRGQLPSQNLQSGGHSLLPGNIQSPQQFSQSNLLELQQDIAAQVSPLQQHRQQLMNKHAHLQFQMMQRQKQQELLIQRLAMMGALSAAEDGPNMAHLGGEIHGIRNIGLGSFSNVMGVGGYTHVPRGGQIPRNSSVGRFNNIPRSNVSRQLFEGISNSAVLSQPRTANGQGRTSIGGYPLQRYAAGLVPMQPPNIEDMAYLLTNQQILPQNQQQQQEIRSVFQPKEENSFVDENVFFPPSQVSSPKFDQQPQTASSSRNLSGFSKDKGKHRSWIFIE